MTNNQSKIAIKREIIKNLNSNNKYGGHMFRRISVIQNQNIYSYTTISF